MPMATQKTQKDTEKVARYLVLECLSLETRTALETCNKAGHTRHPGLRARRYRFLPSDRYDAEVARAAHATATTGSGGGGVCESSEHELGTGIAFAEC